MSKNKLPADPFSGSAGSFFFGHRIIIPYRLPLFKRSRNFTENAASGNAITGRGSDIQDSFVLQPHEPKPFLGKLGRGGPFEEKLHPDRLRGTDEFNLIDLSF